MKAFQKLAIIFVVGLVIIGVISKFRLTSYTEVGRFLGQTKRVEFVVASTLKKDNGDVLLYSGRPDLFFVEIPSASVSRFSKNPDLIYRNEHLKINGVIEQEGKSYKIVSRNRDQIKVLRD